jgi:hypothetical protein
LKWVPRSAVRSEWFIWIWLTLQHLPANSPFTPVRGFKRERQVLDYIDLSAIGPPAGERKNVGLAFIGNFHLDIPVERGA